MSGFGKKSGHDPKNVSGPTEVRSATMAEVRMALGDDGGGAEGQG